MSLRRPFTAALAAGAMIVAPLASAIPALAADSPTVSVSPDSDLDPENANTLEVVGADFSTEGNGVYVAVAPAGVTEIDKSEEHTSELQSRGHLVCRLLLEKKKEAPYTNKHENNSHKYR